MTQHEVAQLIKARTGADPATTKRIMQAFTEVVRESLTGGQYISIRGFGVFANKHRQAKPVQNFHTGERSINPAQTVPSWRAYFEVDTKPEGAI